MPVPQIIPVTDFRQDAAAALDRVRRSREPVIITQRGKAAAVMMSVEAFQELERDRELLRDHLRRAGAGAEGSPVLSEVLAGVRASHAILERYGVRSLSVFGSVARGTAGPGSDVDMLVEFDRPVTLLDLGGLREELGAALGRSVDLATEAALKPEMRERILREAVRAA